MEVLLPNHTLGRPQFPVLRVARSSALAFLVWAITTLVWTPQNWLWILKATPLGLNLRFPQWLSEIYFHSTVTQFHQSTSPFLPNGVYSIKSPVCKTLDYLEVEDLTDNWSHVVNLITFTPNTPQWFQVFIKMLIWATKHWNLNFGAHTSVSWMFQFFSVLVVAITIFNFLLFLLLLPIRAGSTVFSWFFPKPKSPLLVKVQGLEKLTATINQIASRNKGHQASPRPTTWFQILARFFFSCFSRIGYCVLWPFSLFKFFYRRFTPTVDKKQTTVFPSYRFYALDFSSRKNLIVSLIPQLRLNSFNGPLLHKQLITAASEFHWADADAFRAKHHQFRKFKSHRDFFSWFLKWNVDPTVLQTYIVDAHDHAMTLVNPATTYYEVVQTLRQLDSLPYLHFRFQKVMRHLLHSGVFSTPSIKSQLLALFNTCGSYYDFFAVLDAGLYEILPPLPDKPLERPAKVRHYLRNGLPRSVRPPPVVSTLSAAVSSNKRSYFSKILIGSHTTTGFWDQGSTYSFISAELVNELKLKVTPTQDRLHMTAFSSGPISIFDSTIHLEFTIPGIPTKFTHTFHVLSSHVAPVLLGEDFWFKYGVICQPGKQFKLGRFDIPTVSPDLQFFYSNTDNAFGDDDQQDIPEDIQAMLHQFQSSSPLLTLPPSRESDYKIRIDPQATRPPNRPLPKYSIAAAEFLTQEVARLLDLGFIRKCVSQVYAVAQVVPKKVAGQFRMVLDYRAINAITIPIPPHLPAFKNLVPGLHNAKIFSTLDMKQGYYQLKIHESTQPHTAFRVPGGTYCFQVLPFGLTDAPQVFGSYVAGLLHEFAVFTRVYLDDILVFLSSLNEHYQHLFQVISKLHAHSHVLNWDKCIFGQLLVTWIGHEISANGISPTDTSIGQIKLIGVPTTKDDVRAFMGHLAYLQEFIPNFNARATPLTDLLQKNVHFNWSTRCEQAFHDLKSALIHAMPLLPFNPDADIHIHTDASKFAVAAVLLQRDPTDSSKFRPIEYRLQKFRNNQYQWDIHIKELYAVKWAFAKFRYYLEGRSFKVFVDQKSIPQIFNRYLSATAVNSELDPKLQRWISSLFHYKFQMFYQEGASNVLADHLSRNPAFQPLPPSTAGASIELSLNDDWLKLFKDAYLADPTFSSLYEQCCQSQAQVPDYHLLADGNLLYYQSKLCIPQRVLPDFLWHTHMSPAAGHPGVRRWYQDIRTKFHFPDMYNTALNYVASCTVCSRTKSNSHALAGLLQASHPVTGRWTDIATDIVSGFPAVIHENATVNAILTIVDIFTNRVHLYPISSSFSAEDFVTLFMTRYFPNHGLPQSITSDRGPQFGSDFFQSVFKRS